jgi:hypothetical protein
VSGFSQSEKFSQSANSAAVQSVCGLPEAKIQSFWRKISQKSAESEILNRR